MLPCVLGAISRPAMEGRARLGLAGEIPVGQIVGSFFVGKSLFNQSSKARAYLQRLLQLKSLPTPRSSHTARCEL